MMQLHGLPCAATAEAAGTPLRRRYRRQTEALGARRRAKEMEMQKENMDKDWTV